MDDYSPISVAACALVTVFLIWLAVTIIRQLFAAVRDINRIAQASERQAKLLEKLTLQNRSAQHEVEQLH